MVGFSVEDGDVGVFAVVVTTVVIVNIDVEIEVVVGVVFSIVVV